MSKSTKVEIKKGEKAATELNQAADRPVRVNPSNREEVRYLAVPAHGVENPDYTKDQTVRSHEEANDPAAKAAGAIACGEDGMANAKRRAAHVMAKRRETEAIFDSHRKFAAKYPYTKNSAFKKA
jgi:hypothetical protein